MDGSQWIREPAHGVAVVFIHGILSSSDKAWRNDNGAWWPNLLKTQPGFEEIGIYAFQYRCGPSSGSYNLSDAAVLLKNSLESDGVLKCRRIIFVCHSMGGIVARKFVVDCQSLLIERCTEIGFFLVASPSLGSQTANRRLVKLLKHLYGNSQADALRFAESNAWLNDLDTTFMNLKENQPLAIAGRELIEDQSIFLPWLFRRQVVERFSGARYFGDAIKVPNSNHTTIAKPENQSALQHTTLCKFIREYRYTTSPWRAVRQVDLTIGLGSEGHDPVSWMLGICRNLMNVVLLAQPESQPAVNINIEPIREYEEAFPYFNSNLHKYDIVMLDDLWLPWFAPKLKNLSGLEPFQDFFKTNRFENVFVKSLTGICTRTDGSVFAVPISGNLQLLMYRQDLFKAAGGLVEPPTDPDELLEFLERKSTRATARKPFIVRYLFENDVVDNFWELIRAYGYAEQYTPQGEIIIPKRIAQKALDWMLRGHPTGKDDNDGWKSYRHLITEADKEAMMMFGWPVWIMPDLIRNPDWLRFFAMKQFIKHPVMGCWSLAIPETSKHPDEAMKLILALTTVPELQVYMAEAGLVPVLNVFDKNRLKERHLVWNKYLDTILGALKDALPRPRSPRWREIEEELGQQIRNREFVDHPGMFRFAEETSKAAV